MASPDAVTIWGDKWVAFGTEASSATGDLAIVCPFVPLAAFACIHTAANIAITKGAYGVAQDISGNTVTFTLKVPTATGNATPAAASAAGAISYLIIGKG